MGAAYVTVPSRGSLTQASAGTSGDCLTTCVLCSVVCQSSTRHPLSKRYRLARPRARLPGGELTSQTGGCWVAHSFSLIYWDLKTYGIILVPNGRCLLSFGFRNFVVSRGEKIMPVRQLAHSSVPWISTAVGDYRDMTCK